MGKLGCEEKLCIDRHVAVAAGIDPDYLDQGAVVERYEAQCNRVEAAFPELTELPDPYSGGWCSMLTALRTT